MLSSRIDSSACCSKVYYTFLHVHPNKNNKDISKQTKLKNAYITYNQMVGIHLCAIATGHQIILVTVIQVNFKWLFTISVFH